MKITGTSATGSGVITPSGSDLPAAYYISKRRQLEYALDQLNVMDHPAEIQRICREIVAVKKKLQQIGLKKRTY